MAATASEVLEFLDGYVSFAIERREISSAAFGSLRRSLRSIIVKLRESGDQEAEESADRLRSLLSEWLTVPVPFDGTILCALRNFGSPIDIEARWGRDIRSNFETALQGAQELQLVENPVRTSLRSAIRDLKTADRALKIYCHRTARGHFDSLLAEPSDCSLKSEDFLHSVRDYRNSNIFDTLIKVGPLRSWGWGSAPDAIKSAPRFGTLMQIVWSGCDDESDFGYDPVSPRTDAAAAGGVAPVAPAGTSRSPITWTTQVTRSGEDPGVGGGDADELKIFREMAQLHEKRRATLVQVDSEHGILYPPHSQVLSYDPNPCAQESLGRRLPAETLVEGMFVILPLFGDVDLGGVRAEHGHYSQIWKARLEQEWPAAAGDLVKRLRSAGLNLLNMDAAIRNWCKPPSTVIHAPQQMKHFEILVRVLGIDGGGNGSPSQNWSPWWQRAWNEIRRSRGEAIQAGFQEHEIVEGQLLVVLKKLIPQIREKSAVNADFRLVIPASDDLMGEFLFFQVCGIEEGFSAPATEFRVVRELNTIDQWRD